MWPVILTTYNLPPWLCMKEISFMLALLILGPKSPGKNIDVYLRPLIEDLKTINDFPARSSLSGWSRQGYKACLICNKDTPSVLVLSKSAYVGHITFLKKPHKWRSSRKFNGQTDNRDPPKEFGRDEILAQLDRLPTRLTEALEGMPIRPRWIFPFERYMKKLKGYVRNKSKPEGSIAEGYVAEEALTFSSHYFWDVTTKFNRPDRNVDPPPPTYNDKDLEVSTTSELFALACGPTWTPISINSYVVDGVRYVVHSRDERRTTQNSGIFSPSPDGEMYYGQLQEILEFKYLLFKGGETFKNDQYILVTQVKQVFYLEDKAKPHLKVVEHVNHKKFFDEGVIVVEDDHDIIHFNNSSDLSLSTSLNDLDNATLHIDGQSTEVDAPPYIIDFFYEDDDIIDDEDALPHDLADYDEQDLINVDDDGVDKVYSCEEED
nr:hypothetical protein [Tanacetum cinerariifolium]